MRTGEGKTLVATLPVYLNALAGKGVHVVTVNDYLARRDAEWMGRIYKFLGLTVGVIVHGLDRPASGSDNYRCRHHLRHEQRVRLRLPARQHEGLDRALRPARAELRDRRRGRLDPHRRGAHAAHHLAARPRSRPTCTSKVNAIIPSLSARTSTTPSTRRRTRRCSPTTGVERVEKQLGVGNLYDPANIELLHHVDAGAARAHALQARRQLRGRGRQGHHRRRAHRPQDAGPPLVATACTRRSRPRRASRSRKRTRRSRRSRSRTTSACTRSWRA